MRVIISFNYFIIFPYFSLNTFVTRITGHMNVKLLYLNLYFYLSSKFLIQYLYTYHFTDSAHICSNVFYYFCHNFYFNYINVLIVWYYIFNFKLHFTGVTMFQFNTSPSYILVLVIKLILISGNFKYNSILYALKVFNCLRNAYLKILS
jgi:hypothetical protein